MRFLSNAHTHTTYCDGANTAAEMLEAAESLGFVSLGFSGHGAQGFDPDYSMADGRQDEYLRELRALQARRDASGWGPRVWVGLEQDGLTPEAQKAQNKRDCDYVLGSTHYLCLDFHGQWVAVDGKLPLLQTYVNETLGGGWTAMARAYFDAHVRMLLTDRPQIIGHFDIVRKHAAEAGVFDLEAAAYRNMALEALTAALPCGGVLEVNTGDMARGRGAEPYPSEALLRRWLEIGGRVTLTSDCHNASLLNYGLDDMTERLRALGYRSVLRLGRGAALWDEIGL